MAGMFGSQYNDTKVMIDDLSNLSQMNTAAKSSSEGVMKPPKGDEMDAGSWWAWLNGYTRQKTQENIARVQEELASMGVDTTGLSPEYQQSMLEGIQQAQAYRDKWNITKALGDAPTMLEEQGVFPQTSVEQPVGVTEEALGAGTVDISPRAEQGEPRVMDRPAEPEPSSVDTSEPDTAGIMAKPKPKHLKAKVKAPTKEELIDSVFKAEGGYSTDKNDKGNYYKGQFVGTNHGISAPILAQSLGRTPTVADMKALTKEKAKKIAGQYYYDRFKINTLPEDVQEIVFHAVYMGESRGVRAMQNLMGLTPDGIMGPKTKAAMRNAKFTKQEFKDEYLRELKEGTEGYSNPAPTWKEHGKGWTNRYNKLAK